jgi:predicted DNA-binding ribbon-helix-helix protein
MRIDEEFRVEQSPSGDTVMVHGRKSMTVLLRGHLVKRLERVANDRGVSVSALLEEIIEERFGLLAKSKSQDSSPSSTHA